MRASSQPLDMALFEEHATTDSTPNNGGWYTTRRQYRSVAFGTWKVGNARQLSARSAYKKELLHSGSLDANRNYLMQNGYSGALSGREISKCDAYPNDNSSANLPGSVDNIDRLNGNIIIEEPSPVNEQNIAQRVKLFDSHRQYASLTRRQKERLESSVVRSHQRSRSAGNDAVFSVSITPSTSALKRTDPQIAVKTRNHHPNGSMNPLRATKKFFKKIYDSATLPGRSHSKASTSSSISSDNFSTSVSGPFFEIRYSSDTDDEDVYYPEHDLNNISSQRVIDHERTPSTLKSVPDDPMNDSIFTKSTSSSESQKTSSADFRSWSEVFDHLKREITYIREKDAKILSDLRQVETQLQNVKNRSMGVSKSDYSLTTDRSKLRLGDLVESMPL